LRYTRLVITAGVGALLLTGCTEGAGEDVGAGGGSVVRDVVTEADIVLPVSAYLFTREQQALVDTANSTLASDCMKRFGFDWPVKKAEPVKVVNRRYSVVGEKVAAEHGYHVITSAGDDEHAEGAVSSGAKFPPEAYMIYGAKGGKVGASGSYQGKDIPQGGCLGEAGRKLGLDKVQDPTKGKIGLLSIDFSSFGKAQEAPEFKKAQDEWVACMKKAGYQHTTFLQPAEKYASQGDSASPQEKVVAKADVKCKQETKLATVLLRLETQIQNDYIEQNAAGFAEIKKDQGAVIKSANEALAN
jgi:predicted small secreted protein